MSARRQLQRRYAGTSWTPVDCRVRRSTRLRGGTRHARHQSPGHYTLLGERFAGWPGAVLALAVGALVPAIVAVTLGAAYVELPIIRSRAKLCREPVPERWPSSPGRLSDCCAPNFSSIAVAGSLDPRHPRDDAVSQSLRS